MSGAEVRSTALDLAFVRRSVTSQSRKWPFTRSRPSAEAQREPQDPEYRLPDRVSLFIVLFMSALLQVSHTFEVLVVGKCLFGLCSNHSSSLCPPPMRTRSILAERRPSRVL